MLRHQSGRYGYPTPPFYEQKAIFIALLSFLTLGFYEHYWHYRNWKTIQNVSGDYSISPVLRGIFFPFFIMSLVSVVRGSADIQGLKPGLSRRSFAVFYTIVAFIFGGATFLGIETWHSFVIPISISVFMMCLLQAKISTINRSFSQGLSHTENRANVDAINIPASSGTIELVRRDAQYRSFLLPHRYLIEFATVVFVIVISYSIALQDGGRFIAKTNLLDVLSFSSSAKAEISEVYALTGEWPEGNLSYLMGDYGSRVIKTISTSASGEIRFALAENSPFEIGDAIELEPDESGYQGPMSIIRWTCTGHLKSKASRPFDNEDYLPSVCRGIEE